MAKKRMRGERYLAAQLFPFFNCTSLCAPIVSFPSLFLSETEQINEEERRARLEKGLGTLVRISFEFSSVFIFARTSYGKSGSSEKSLSVVARN